MQSRLRAAAGLFVLVLLLVSACDSDAPGARDAGDIRDGEAQGATPPIAADAGAPDPDDSGADPGRADAGGESPDAASGEASDGSVVPEDAGPPAPPKPPVGFEPPGRGFRTSLALTLTPGDASAAVHYTLDGSLPTASSARATAAIALDQTRLVRAIAIKDGVSSAVFSQTYFKLDASLDGFSSNLPVLVAHLLGGAAPVPTSREYVPGVFGVFTPDSGRTSLEGVAAHTSRFGIKRRGRSTRSQDKPSYTLELWGSDREDAPAALLGLPADGDWVLYAPYSFDRAFVRNAFAYELSRRLGRYAPRTKFCELFVVDGNSDVTEADYVGIYVLTERVTRGAARVPIDELDVDDVTDPARSGGYLFKADQADMPGESFMAAGQQFVYVDPDVDEIALEQIEYIQGYLDAVLRAAQAGDGRDPQAGPFLGKHYEELIDVGAFIDFHVLNLFLKNPDSFMLSAHYYKQRDGKLFAGPLWDFDLAMGGYDDWGERSEEPMYWGPGASDELFRRSFWGPLFDHAEFQEAYWARWNDLLEGPFDAEAFRTTIETFEAELMEAEERDRERWPNKPAPVDPLRLVQPSFADEIDYLESWLEERLSWVSANLGIVP
jgi:CotH kinase protein/Chitobiase/beta-hexosaminidase C-terminal domain